MPRRRGISSTWKALHSVVSATVYAELKKTRRPAATRVHAPLVAFADPSYPAFRRDELDGILNAEVRGVVRSGYALEPLPASRAEVAAIAKLYGDSVVSYVGAAATEERAKAIGPHRPLRALCHARPPRRTLSAQLGAGLHACPSKPAEGEDNGLLQAWEIFEQVRLDADLVTLSACESGLGKELGGEGLVELDARVSVRGRPVRPCLALECRR